MKLRTNLLALGFAALTAAPVLAHDVSPMQFREVWEGERRFLELEVNQPNPNDFVFLVAGTRRIDVDFGSFRLQVLPELILPLGQATGDLYHFAIPAELEWPIYVQALRLHEEGWAITASAPYELENAHQPFPEDPVGDQLGGVEPQPIDGDVRQADPQPVDSDMRQADPKPVEGDMKQTDTQPLDPDAQPSQT